PPGDSARDSQEAPAGTGGPGRRGQPPRFRVRWWVWVVLALLAINLFGSMAATQARSRVRVAYTPFFLHAVRTGEVAEITAKGSTVQGTFTRALSYRGSKPTKRFATEIPSFANTDALSALLVRKGVVVNAKPLDKGGPWWEQVLLGFGPTILF